MFKRDLHRLKECRVGQRDLSDHTGVYLTLHLDGSQRKTLWRLNTGMLNDPAFRDTMQSDLNNYLQDNDKGDVTPCILWDAATVIIARTALAKKMKAIKFQDLQEKLRDLE